MGIYEDIRKIWDDNRGFEKRLNASSRFLTLNSDLLHQARNQFRSWYPFRVYLSYTNAKTAVSLSVSRVRRWAL